MCYFCSVFNDLGICITSENLNKIGIGLEYQWDLDGGACAWKRSPAACRRVAAPAPLRYR